MVSAQVTLSRRWSQALGAVTAAPEGQVPGMGWSQEVLVSFIDVNAQGARLAGF